MHFDVLRRCHYVIKEKSNIDCFTSNFLGHAKFRNSQEHFQVMFAGHLCSHVAGP